MGARWLLVLGSLPVLAGCTPARGSAFPGAPGRVEPPGPVGSPGHAAVPEAVSVRTDLRIGGRPALRRTQDLVLPWTPGDVDRLSCELHVLDGAESLVASLSTPAGSGVGQTVDWVRLGRNRTYRLKVFALDARGGLLSAGGIPAVRDFSTGTDDFLALSIAIPLRDRTFEGQIHPIVRAASSQSARVDRLSLVLSKKEGEAWVVVASGQTPGGSGLGRTVDFINLRRFSDYLVEVTALNVAGRAIAAASASVPVQADDLVTVGIAL